MQCFQLSVYATRDKPALVVQETTDLLQPGFRRQWYQAPWEAGCDSFGGLRFACFFLFFHVVQSLGDTEAKEKVEVMLM